MQNNIQIVIDKCGDDFCPDNILLADIDLIKKESYLDANVSSESIRHALIFVQDSIAELVTGSCLLEQLKRLVCTDEIYNPYYSMYRRLLDSYLFPILVNGVQAELASKLSFQERNHGIVRHNDNQHLSYPGVSDIKYIRQDYNRNTDFYITRAIRFIKCNRSCFCELCCCSYGCDCSHAPFQRAYSIGINLEVLSENRSSYTGYYSHLNKAYHAGDWWE